MKHYLRGEDGIYYEDLYGLVKFLPSYALPPSIPSPLPSPLEAAADAAADEKDQNGPYPFASSAPALRETTSAPHLPSTGGPPLRKVRTHASTRTQQYQPGLPHLSIPIPEQPLQPQGPASPLARMRERLSPILPVHSQQPPGRGMSLGPAEDPPLLPSANPPKYHLFDVFPFSLFVKYLAKKGKNLKGKRAARIRARLAAGSSHNIPLEISFYLARFTACASPALR